jgi:hypothetical protein
MGGFFRLLVLEILQLVIVSSRFASFRWLSSLIVGKCSECRRRAAMVCDTFERGRDLEQRRFVERSHEELESNR